MNICESCGSLAATEAVEHGFYLCLRCAADCNIECEDCGQPTAERGYPWTQGRLCERCERKRARSARLDQIAAIVDAIDDLAAERCWSIDWQVASTDSHYGTIDLGIAEVVVRVADHGECYCREDVSFEIPMAPADAIQSLRRVCAAKLWKARRMMR